MSARTPEQKGRSKLDRCARHMLRLRKWSGAWKLITTENDGRQVSWSDFQMVCDGSIVAVTPVIFLKEQWWIVAAYVIDPTYISPMAAFAAMGYCDVPPSYRLKLQLWSSNPAGLGRTLTDHVDHPDDVVRIRVRSYRQLKKAFAS